MADAPNGPLLSVIVPVYNEAATVGELLRRLLAAPYPDKQIIIVDDGSDDETAAAIGDWEAVANVVVLRHTANRGKGAAVRTGLGAATGRITVIQDADLEYDPGDLPAVVQPIQRGEALAVYGSRYLRPVGLPWSRFRLAVVLLNGLVRFLYGQRLTDEATCYKALPTALYRALNLRSEGFELCPEITANLCRSGVRIVEAPISYHPRGAGDGKKIGWRDAWRGFWALVKWRFVPFDRAAVVKLLDDDDLCCFLPLTGQNSDATVPRLSGTWGGTARGRMSRGIRSPLGEGAGRCEP